MLAIRDLPPFIPKVAEDVLGFTWGRTGAILAVFGMAVKLFPVPHDTGTRVSIAVGMEGAGQRATGFGGKIDVHLFNAQGLKIGNGIHDRKIIQGTSKYDFTYKHNKKYLGQGAYYGMFTGDDDGICIAWVAMTWADKTKDLVSGDWGRFCGYPWSYSNLQLSVDDAGHPYKPSCIWVDKNGDIPTTAFQVYFPDISVHNRNTVSDPKHICNSPSFRVSDKPDDNTVVLHADHGQNLPHYTRGTPPPHNVTESIEKPPGAVDNRVIITPHPQHRASDLCNSPHSRGPSVISQSEGLFCDMRTRILHQLCGKEFGEECFDENSLSFYSANAFGRPVMKRSKQFESSQVIDWTAKDGQ